MPAPTSTAFLRPDLGQSFEEFDLMMSASGFIGSKCLPIMDVALQTANFSKIPVEQLLRSPNTLRASGAGYNRSDWLFEQDNYSCEEHGAEEILDDRERAIYAYSLDFERISAARAVDAILRDYEINVATALFNPTTWTGASLTTAVTNEWDDRANCTPVDDIMSAHASVRASCGMEANTLIMSVKVWRNLLRSDQVTDLLKHSGIDDPKQLTLNGMAALMQVEQVLVGHGVRNTAAEGQAASISDIWDDEYVMLAKIPKSADLREPGVGRTFHFTGDGSSSSVTIEQYREEARRGEVIRARMDYDIKVIHPQAAHLLSNITS